MARLLWLADVLRDAGLTVAEHIGFRTADGTIGSWQTHVRPGDWTPRYGVVHATAAPRTQVDGDQVRIVRDGRSDLPGPIAVACVDRLGRWHVVGAGRCNTTLVGTSGPYEGLGNAYAIGVEACNDNGLRTATYQPPAPEPWPEVQYQAYVVGWAAICRRLGWGSSRLVGHKEHTPGHKTDPTFDMNVFRRNVAGALAGTFPPPPQEVPDMLVLFTDEGKKWVGDGVTRRQISDAEASDLQHIASKGALKLTVWADMAEVANPGAFGAVPAVPEAVLSEAQVEKIAAQLIAATDNPLGEADKPAIVAALKQALREGAEG